MPVPTLASYVISKQNITMDSTKDIVTLNCGTTREARIYEIKLIGMGTSFASGAIGLYRSSGGTGGTGGGTIQKLSTDFPNPHLQFWTAWSTTQPTLVGDPLLIFDTNGNGFINRWLALKGSGQEIFLRSQEQLSLRPISGTHLISFHVFWEEI